MRNLLVAIDFSEVTSRVLDTASQLAQALGARVRLVHVAAPDPDFVGYEEDPPALRESHAAAYRDEHRRLQALADDLRGRGLDARALLIRGPTVEKLLEEAQRTGSDLIVVGSHGRGALKRALLGSVSEGLLRRSDRPVVIVPSRAPSEPEPA